MRRTTRRLVATLLLAVSTAPPAFCQCGLLDRLVVTSAADGTGHGWRVATDGEWAAVATSGSQLSFLQRTNDDWVERQTLDVPDFVQPEAMVLHGDGLAVGHFDGLATGFVSVFQCIEDVWALQSRLEPFDEPPASSSFGKNIAFERSLIVAGHPDDDVAGRSRAGSIYLYRRIGRQWLVESKIAAPEPMQGGAFGSALAIAGEFVFVRAERSPLQLPSRLGGSQVYVFRRVTGSWTLVDRLKDAPSEVSVEFANAMAGKNDQLAVLGHSNDADGRGGGESRELVVRIYRRDDARWILRQIITPTDRQIEIDFPGEADGNISLDDDRLVVPCLKSGAGPELERGVTAYHLVDDSWTLEAEIPSGRDDDHFGRSLAAAGGTVLIASPFDDTNAPGHGATYSWIVGTPPTARLDVDTSDRVLVDTEIVFDSSRSTPGSAASIEVAHWSFGDGAEAFAETVAHRYDRPGLFEVRLRVISSAGVCDESSGLVEVICRSDPPAPWQVNDPEDAQLPGGVEMDGDGHLDGTTCVEVCAVIPAKEASIPDVAHTTTRRLDGNFELSARFEAIDSAHTNGQAGLLIREPIVRGRFVAMLVEIAGNDLERRDRVVVLYRRQRDGEIVRVEGPEIDDSRLWIALRREGRRVFARLSSNRVLWETTAELTLDLPRESRVGFSASGVAEMDGESITPLRARFCEARLEFLTPLFIRGDANSDGEVGLSDTVFTLAFLFRAGPAPRCLLAGDANGDGELDLSDGVYPLGFLFLGGAPPPQPFPDCGLRAREESRSRCEDYPVCP